MKPNQTKFIWSIDRTLSGASTRSQNGPGSNGNEVLLCITQISKARPLPCHIQNTCWGWVLPLCRDAVSVFSSPSQLGYQILMEEKSWHTLLCQQSLEYADCIDFRGVTPIKTASGGKAPVLELCGVPFYCHYSQIHSDHKWYHLLGSQLCVKLFF